MASSESDYYGINIEILNWKSEGILLGIFGYSKLGLSDNTMLGVADSSKLVEYLGCFDGSSFGVFE